MSEDGDIYVDSPALDDIPYTPEIRAKMSTLKLKASQTLKQGSPTVTKQFLQWRPKAVTAFLEFRAMQRQAPTWSASSQSTQAELLKFIEMGERRLLFEKAYLLSDSKSIEGDLNDIVYDKNELLKAYLNELRMSMEVAVSAKTKPVDSKALRLGNKEFSDAVYDYLGTRRVLEGGCMLYFCNVLGLELGQFEVECARIVPSSWNTKEFAYMFGADGSFASKRNGLSLQHRIGEAFDNCWLTIVPIETVQATPTEWKVVLLNESVRNNTFCVKSYESGENWTWKDIDGRKLTFLNDNRPARRFLYLRYILAELQADKNAWPGFKDKFPPAEVWASPNKPDGYLRKSVLVELRERTGNKLPKRLLDAGSFEDAATSNAVHDELAAIRVTEKVRSYLEGERDPKPNDEDDDYGECRYCRLPM